MPWKPYLRTWNRLYRSKGSAYMYASAGIVWWNAVSNTATCSHPRSAPLRAAHAPQPVMRLSLISHTDTRLRQAQASPATGLPVPEHRPGAPSSLLCSTCCMSPKAHRAWLRSPHFTRAPCPQTPECKLQAHQFKHMQGAHLGAWPHEMWRRTCGFPGKILAAALMPLRFARLCLHPSEQPYLCVTACIQKIHWQSTTVQERTLQHMRQSQVGGIASTSV